jgi:large subunit ribosomal protein L32
MPQPKKKTSSSKQGHRRQHWMNALKMPNLSTCSNCGAPTLPHQACRSCGHYKGRTYVVARKDA